MRVVRAAQLACALLLAGCSSPGTRDAAIDCADLESDAERLACFDRNFPGTEPGAEPGDVAQPRPPAREPEAAPSDPPQSAETPAPTSVEPTPTAGAPEPMPRDTSLLGDPKIDLTATIRHVRRGDKQRMVFLLDNEQIWMQSTPRSLPFKEGDEVTIKNAFFGGYFMRSDKGTGTRVKRIR